ncbi:MAG: response regulator [Bacteroidales bacterium]
MKIIEILIVEDSRTQAEELKYILENYNYSVTHTLTAEKALEILNGFEPDIIFSDIVMPGMDGYSFCSIVKSDLRLQKIPVILLTSLSDPKDIMKGLECGADSFLIKPFNDEILYSRIQYFIQNADLRKSQSERTLMEILFANQKYQIHSSPRQIMDVLLSTYENSILKYHELNESNVNLKNSLDRITWMNASLEQKFKSKSQELEVCNDKLTAELHENSTLRENISFEESILRIASRLFNFGGWCLNIADNRVLWSDAVAAIHEMPVGYSPELKEAILFFAPDWRELFQNSFTNCIEHNIPFDNKMQIITASGKNIWVRIIGEALKNKDGQIIKVIGTIHEITS